MGLQGYQQNFPAPQTAIIDLATGTFTKDARYLLLALWNRTGQGTGLPSVAADLVADGITPVNISTDWSLFLTVASNGIGILPPLLVGASAVIMNQGINSLSIQPASGVQIDTLGVGGRYVLVPNKMQIISAWTPTQLYTMNLA